MCAFVRGGGGGGVCAYSGVEVDGYLSVAFRLHFGKFNAD